MTPIETMIAQLETDTAAAIAAARELAAEGADVIGVRAGTVQLGTPNVPGRWTRYVLGASPPSYHWHALRGAIQVVACGSAAWAAQHGCPADVLAGGAS